MYLNGKIKVSVTRSGETNSIVLPYINSVVVKNDSLHIGSSCDIVMPLMGRIPYDNADKTLTKLPLDLFSTGDRVSVSAKYVGYESADYSVDGWLPIFDGYLFDFYLGTPLTIKCLDAVYLLNQNLISKQWQKETLKNIIDFVLTGTGITQLPVEKEYTDEAGNKIANPIYDLTLENLSFSRMSPASILDWFKKELGFNISLQGNKLYVNIASNTLLTAYYNSSLNVVTCDFQTYNAERGDKPASVYQKLKLTAWFVNEDGTKDKIERGDSDGQNREVYFYKVLPRTEANYTKLADEALKKFRQQRYSGTITTFLYPYIDLFWRAEYIDVTYPERSGVYEVIEQTISLTPEEGFKRKLKMAYLRSL